MKTIDCGTHGRKPWNGEIVCSQCGRVFTTHDASLRSHAPRQCPCGVQLMPSGDSASFAARPCCTECFDGRRLAS